MDGTVADTAGITLPVRSRFMIGKKTRVRFVGLAAVGLHGHNREQCTTDNGPNRSRHPKPR